MELNEGSKIPADWKVKRLGEIAQITMGRTPSRRISAFWGKGHSWLSIADLKSKYVFETREEITDLALPSMTLIPRGTLMMSFKLSIGKLSFTGRDMYSNEAICSLKNLQENPEYIYYSLSRVDFTLYGKQAVKGYTLNTESLNSIEVPLPPLPEQRAIAAALSDVDALLASLDALIAKKRDLKQAAMQQLLTGKRRLPGFGGAWEVKRLGEIGTFTKGKGIKKDDVLADGIPCIRYGEIYTRHNDYVKRFYSFIPRSVANQSQPLRRGDLLFAGSGETAEEIGKCVAFLGDEEAYAGGDIVILNPCGQDSLYLGYLLNHASIVAQKARMGQGDAVVHISAGSLAQIELQLPPREEQAAIAAVLSDMDADFAAIAARRDKTSALKQGMMQELLTGRIRLV